MLHFLLLLLLLFLVLQVLFFFFAVVDGALNVVIIHVVNADFVLVLILLLLLWISYLFCVNVCSNFSVLRLNRLSVSSVRSTYARVAKVWMILDR